MLEKLKNKPILINSDLDGIISGLLLKKYLNCTVVGFTNSAETIWIQKGFTNFEEICFVDMFVANPKIVCIDQHIISVNEKHHAILKKNQNKINPNLLSPHFHLPNSSYKTKYPFGTVHFIIALLEKEGFDLSELLVKNTNNGIVDFDDLDLEKSSNTLSFIDLILRADDTMKTTVDSRYVDNATNWWKWLIELSNNGKTTLKLKDYLDSLDAKKASEIKKTIKDLLQHKPFLCDSSDGGITELTSVNGFLKVHAKRYFKFISQLSNIEIFNIDCEFKTYKGITKRLSLNKKQQQELIEFNTIDSRKVFSYAFVRTESREDSFSCTFYQKD
ncbi:MAG: hypothetical protein L3J14_00785 [Flavobacteriaceae bacterium]|nr:hypothetical protein [Flavobacteriaceae bacterium]